MLKKGSYQGVVKALVVLGAAAVIPACGVGGGTGGPQGAGGGPKWNSNSGTSNGMALTPGAGPIWNPAGSVLIPGPPVTGLDVSYSEADVLDFPNINIPNAKPPVVMSPYAGEPVTSSGILDPQNFESTIEALFLEAFSTIYKNNNIGFGGGGIGGIGGIGVPIGGAQNPVSARDGRCEAVGRGYCQTVMDKGALPPTPAKPAQTNPTPPSLDWRLMISGGNVAAINTSTEYPVINQVGGTPQDTWNTMQGGGNPGAVSNYIMGANAGSTVFYGAGYRGNQNANPGPLNSTDLVVVVATNGVGGGF
jgi:hypothetical protein